MGKGIARNLGMLRQKGPWGVAKPTLFNGVKYRSRAEADYAERLTWLLKDKRIKAWKRATFYRIEINGVRCGRYTPDFEVTHLDSSTEIVEVKGWAARDFLFRFNVFCALHPQFKVTVVDSQGKVYDPNKRKTRKVAQIAGVGAVRASKAARVRQNSGGLDTIPKGERGPIARSRLAAH
jgi:hypothetical protein